nr:alpha 2 macroglobulin [Hymenolepis microstoma]
MILSCATCFGIILIPGDDVEYVDAENPVEIFLPKEFYIDTSNRIVMNSLKPIVKVSINICLGKTQMGDIGNTVYDQLKRNHSVDDRGNTYILRYFMPIQLPPSTLFTLKFTYWYCRNDNCLNRENIINRTVEKEAQTVRRYILIMGETDKTIYRPGEHVKFRFIALTSRQLFSNSEPSYWPTFKVVEIGRVRASPLLINSDERQRYLNFPIFDSIEVRDPFDKIQKRWEYVNSVKAFNLSYWISTNAKEGHWKIIAKARMSSEMIKIFVKAYTTPWFRAKVILPDIIRLMDFKSSAEICAEHKNGSPVRGTFTAQICVCDQYILERQYEVGKQFHMNMCVDIFNKRTRFCKEVAGILDGAKCSNISVNISELVKGEAVLWTEKLGTFVEIDELNTGKTVVTSEICKLEKWPEPVIELKMKNTYKTGIPITGQIIYRNAGKREGEELEVIVRELKNACNRWKISTADNPAQLIRLISVKPNVDVYNFTLPPLYFRNSIYITVQQRRKLEDSKVDLSNSILDTNKQHSWSDPPGECWNLSASKILDLWDNSLGPAIQVTLVNKINDPCRRSVMLGVISNQPLSRNTTMTLHFLSHGHISRQQVTLDSVDSYLLNENDFSRNNSTKSDPLQCSIGWTGENCLIPVCEGDCGEGGLCAAPERCVCKPGWSGDTCEIAPQQKLNPGDESEEEGKSVYKPGFMHVGVNEKHIPRKVTYIYNATLELDNDFGPEFRAVASILIDGKLVTDFIKIDELYPCSSPQPFEKRITLEIGKQTVIPGERFDINLSAENKKDPAVCFLSLSTVKSNLHSRKINPNFFTESLKGYHNLDGEESIMGTEDAFRAADIIFVQVLSKGKLINSEVFPVDCTHSGYLGQLAIEGPSGAPEFPAADPLKEGISRYMNMGPHALKMFPEIIFFEALSLQSGTLNKTFTVPSYLNTWEVNAFCFSGKGDIWIPKVKPNFTIQMPFYIDFAPPVSAKRSEILLLKIYIITAVSKIGASEFNCYDLNVSLEVDSQNLQIIGSPTRSASICFRFNITAKVVGKHNSFLMNYKNDAGVKVDFLIQDAVQRTLQVTSEGVEKKIASHRILCSAEGKSSIRHGMQSHMPNERLLPDSLHSYLALGVTPLTLVLNNLNSETPLPTGFGRSNLAFFTPSIHILRYILQNQSRDIAGGKELIETFVRNIIRGLDNQVQFYHAKTGGFSNLGESHGDTANLWLTASVFQTFNEAAKLPLAALSGEFLNTYSILSASFDYLASQQDAKGCFLENGHTTERASDGKLLLTAHILSALNTACAELKQLKGKEYEEAIRSASKCVEGMIEGQHINKVPTYILARVVHALKDSHYFSNPTKGKRLLSELKWRSESGVTTMCWRAFAGTNNNLKDLETTAYAVLSIGAENLSRRDRLAVLRWIVQQHGENEGLYSYQDSAISIRALIKLSESFFSPFSEKLITIKSKPENILNIRMELNKRDLYKVHSFEIDSPNITGISEVNVGIMASKLVCISTDFTTIYNVPEPLKFNSNFELEISNALIENSGNATCTIIQNGLSNHTVADRMDGEIG